MNINRLLCLLVAMAGFATTATHAHPVSSQALVPSTRDTGYRAMDLLRGEPHPATLRFVYGYGPHGPASCAGAATAPTGQGDHYGVLVCDADAVLASAYFVYPWSQPAGAPGGRGDQRLARIAAETLLPHETVSQPGG